MDKLRSMLLNKRPAGRFKSLHPIFIAAMWLASLTCASGAWPSGIALQIRPGGSYLGVGLRDIDADRAHALNLPEAVGVEIVAVEEGGSADMAGIRPGDVLISYNSEKVLSAQQLIRLVSETPVGRHLRILCWRNGEKKELWVTTGQTRSASTEESDTGFRSHVTDVPYPMMVWRNLILGIESEMLGDQLAQAVGVKQGILVWSVNLGSPAQRAGLRAGDVVTGFCGRAIRTPRELGSALQSLQSARKPASIDIVRDHKPISLAISLEPER